MRVLVAGAHGNTGQRIVRLLPGAGHEAVALVRAREQGPALERLGAQVVVADLEDDPSPAVAGVDAVVFAAGAGAGSGAPRKETVDYGGAVKLAAAAERHGAQRFVVLSAKWADEAASYDGVMRVYMDAKARADADVRGRDLDWTIVRPGPLSDDEPAGTVAAGDDLDGRAPSPARISPPSWSRSSTAARSCAGSSSCSAERRRSPPPSTACSPGARSVLARPRPEGTRQRVSADVEEVPEPVRVIGDEAVDAVRDEPVHGRDVVHGPRDDLHPGRVRLVHQRLGGERPVAGVEDRPVLRVAVHR